MNAQKLDEILAPLGKFFFPTRCTLCDQLLKDDSVDMCPVCRLAEMVVPNDPWKIPHVKRWLAVWNYAGDVRRSLIRYKFWKRSHYSITYGRELAQKLRTSGFVYDVITWVPISRLRRIGRGFDQVELLAQEVGKQLDTEPLRLLHKHRHNRKQANILDVKKRQENVKGVYIAVNKESIKGKRILLLEDIVTTGATVSEAARILREAGAREVSVACIAVAKRHQPF